MKISMISVVDNIIDTANISMCGIFFDIFLTEENANFCDNMDFFKIQGHWSK